MNTFRRIFASLPLLLAVCSLSAQHTEDDRVTQIDTVRGNGYIYEITWGVSYSIPEILIENISDPHPFKVHNKDISKFYPDIPPGVKARQYPLNLKPEHYLKTIRTLKSKLSRQEIEVLSKDTSAYMYIPVVFDLTSGKTVKVGFKVYNKHPTLGSIILNNLDALFAVEQMIIHDFIFSHDPESLWKYGYGYGINLMFKKYKDILLESDS